mgnify:CR=1 FL=1
MLDFSEANKSEKSLKIDPELISVDKFSQYSSIPSDFNEALRIKNKNKHNSKLSDSASNLNIKFNKFPNKLK